MIDPRILAISVTDPSGGVHRWGPDEASVEDVPSGISFSTKIPGGYNTFSCDLFREANFTYPDLIRFAPMRCYGQGNLSGFEGYLAEIPATQDEVNDTVSPGAIGNVAMLRDNKSFREIYVDRDLSRWVGPSRQRQLNLGAYTEGSFEITTDITNGNPSLSLKFEGSWPAGKNPIAHAVYDGQGIEIGEVRGTWDDRDNLNLTDVNWTLVLSLMVDDAWGGESNTGDLQPLGQTGVANKTGTGKYFAGTYFHYNSTPAGTDGHSYIVDWRNLAVFGSHGLVRQGAEPGGFYASDIVNDVLSRTCPQLSRNISQSDFIIPHAAFTEPTTADEVVTAVSKYHLPDWGVYDSMEFFWRPTGTGRKWKLRISDGVSLRDEGVQTETSYNGVIVAWQDPAGSRFTIGPPESGSTFTDGTLFDGDPQNPLNQYNRRKYERLDIGISSRAGALLVGQRFLEEMSVRKRRGSVIMTGWATDEAGIAWPAWMVRAGDQISVADAADPSYRLVVDTNYNHDSLEMTANLDSPPNKLDALLERLGVSLVALAL